MTDEEIVARVTRKLTSQFYIGARVRLTAETLKQFDITPASGQLVSPHDDIKDCWLVVIGDREHLISARWMELE